MTTASTRIIKTSEKRMETLFQYDIELDPAKLEKVAIQFGGIRVTNYVRNEIHFVILRKPRRKAIKTNKGNHIDFFFGWPVSPESIEFFYDLSARCFRSMGLGEKEFLAVMEVIIKKCT